MRLRIVVSCLLLLAAAVGYGTGHLTSKPGAAHEASEVARLRDENAALGLRLANAEATLEQERAGTRLLRDALDKARTNREVKSAEATAETPVIEIEPGVSPREEFDKNEVAFLQKYKRLRISSAYVHKVETVNGRGHAAVVSIVNYYDAARIPDQVWDLDCEVSEAEDVAELRNGDLVSVEGVPCKDITLRLRKARVVRQQRQADLSGWEAWPIVEVPSGDWSGVLELLKKDESRFWERYRGKRFLCRFSTGDVPFWLGRALQLEDGKELPQKRWLSLEVVGVPMAVAKTGGLWPRPPEDLKLIHSTYTGTEAQ